MRLGATGQRPLPSDALWPGAVRRLALRLRELHAPLSERAQRASAAGSLHERAPLLLQSYGALFQLGLQRARLPREAGGLALSLPARLVVAEEIARADAGAALALISCWNAAATLHALASPLAQREVLQPVLEDASGAQLLASAMSEPQVGADAFDFQHQTDLRTRVRRTREGYEVNGEKWMMTNGGLAAAYIVVAQERRGVRGRRFCIVPRDAPGLRVTPIEKRGLRTASHARLQLTNVRLHGAYTFALPASAPADAVRRSKAHAQAQALGLASTTLETGAVSLGLAQAALELAQAHAYQRKQGGRLLHQHPVIALRLAEGRGQVEAARAYLWQGAEQLERGQGELLSAAAARALASSAARRCCTLAQELLCNSGAAANHPLERLSADVDLLLTGPATTDLLLQWGA